MSSCNYCSKIQSLHMGINKYNINGTCIVYIKEGKYYAKECCLKSLYTGNNAIPIGYTKILGFIKKNKPKYILTENEKFMVYKTPNKQIEIITDPYNYGLKDKLRLNRNINYKEYPDKYKFIKENEFNNNAIQSLIPNNTKKLCNQVEYIYLLQNRTSIQTNKSIYKIGRTSQPNFERFKGYDKGYKILLHIICDNCIEIETNLIQLFKIKYKHREDYGNEYFEGDYKEMIKDIYNAI
jgi:hypothetical protein